MSKNMTILEENHDQIENISINSIISEISDELVDTIYEMAEEISKTGTCDTNTYASQLEGTCQVFADQVVDLLKESRLALDRPTNGESQ